MIIFKGKQQNVSLDYATGKTLITYMVESASAQSLEWCRDKELSISVKQYKQHRSLDANAYYWLLIGKLAPKLKMSTTELHNRMISDHGQLELVGGQTVDVILPDTLEAERTAAKAEMYHLKPTTYVFEDGGSTKRLWQMMRGSHTYNTEEFSDLLNGLIEECKWQDIPTETPDQIARMMALYGERYEKHNAG